MMKCPGVSSRVTKIGSKLMTIITSEGMSLVPCAFKKSWYLCTTSLQVPALINYFFLNNNGSCTAAKAGPIRGRGGGVRNGWGGRGEGGNGEWLEWDSGDGGKGEEERRVEGWSLCQIHLQKSVIC